MARLLALLALLLTAPFAGCLDAADAREADDADPADGEAALPGSPGPGSHGRSSVTSTHDLGSASGSSVQPARFDFTVEVPAGGARSVRWSMTIETAGISQLNRVEGPGCTGVVQSVTLLGSNTFGGECDDLSTGTHTFTAVLGSPALAFEASVRGQATVVTEW